MISFSSLCSTRGVGTRGGGSRIKADHGEQISKAHFKKDFSKIGEEDSGDGAFSVTANTKAGTDL